MIEPPERLPERDRAIEAMLPHVPFEGWTNRALRHGLADAGLPPDEADLLFPGGAIDMIETWCDLADRRMAEAAGGLSEARLPARVRALIALRLAQNRPHKEAMRRALGLLALPGNARVAAACTARTVDTIWHAAGDVSADFSWYTKRAILFGIYTATMLFWLSDADVDDQPTLAFVDRRLAGIGAVGRLRGQVAALAGRFRPA